jgi:hypothetical protein
MRSYNQSLTKGPAFVQVVEMHHSAWDGPIEKKPGTAWKDGVRGSPEQMLEAQSPAPPGSGG